ncbi:MAG TPA: hypothetical protein VF093_03525 [Solirubrobacterales bacterium]
MAQTKTKKAKSSSKSKSRASSGSAKAKAPRKPKATKRPQRPRHSGNGSKATSHNGISNGIEGGAKAARDAVRSAGKDAAHVANKAKVPLLAGGAALVGTVGGVVLGSTHSGDKVLGISLPKRKRVRVRSKDLAKAAKGVGRFGNNVGELGAELRRVRQGLASDNEKQNSPLEVLLKGLTTRR